MEEPRILPNANKDGRCGVRGCPKPYSMMKLGSNIGYCEQHYDQAITFFPPKTKVS